MAGAGNFPVGLALQKELKGRPFCAQKGSQKQRKRSPPKDPKSSGKLLAGAKSDKHQTESNYSLTTQRYTHLLKLYEWKAPSEYHEMNLWIVHAFLSPLPSQHPPSMNKMWTFELEYLRREPWPTAVPHRGQAWSCQASLRSCNPQVVREKPANRS